MIDSYYLQPTYGSNGMMSKKYKKVVTSLTEIYRLIFEQLTSQLTFALDPLSEYVILA